MQASAVQAAEQYEGHNESLLVFERTGDASIYEVGERARFAARPWHGQSLAQRLDHEPGSRPLSMPHVQRCMWVCICLALAQRQASFCCPLPWSASGTACTFLFVATYFMHYTLPLKAFDASYRRRYCPFSPSWLRLLLPHSSAV